MATASRSRNTREAPVPGFPVVGVGASAGGVEAFTALLRALPDDPGIALVLVQHLEPTHQSILPKLLSKATAMPVHEVTDGMVVQPNQVYVIPANRRSGIAKGVLTLAPRTRGFGSLPVDDFFCALAEDAKSRAFGVVLSGLASDGTQGLEAIKAEGGITFAQDEESTRCPGMPASAAAVGCVDFVMPPEAIAAELARMSRHPYIRTANQPGESSLAPGHSDEAIRRICAALLAATGVDLELYKPAAIQRQVARRLVLKKVDGLDDYLRLIQHDRAELEALFHDIFIHSSGFFRDPEALQALRRTVIAGMVANRASGDAVRVWVPGCSSGEEAYTIAMILNEAFGKQAAPPRLQVFATDISAPSIERARTGFYPESAMARISPARRERFFDKVERGYRIAKPVRESCVFARHDLGTDPPFSRLNLISCRDALIYMGAVLQKRVLETFHYALQPAGHLFLGKSESLGGSAYLFSVEDRKNKIYLRRPAAAPARAAASAAAFPAVQGQAVSTPPLLPDPRREAERILLDRYVPPALVVNPDLYIVHFHGDTSPYMAPAAGQASLHLLRMVRPELLVELRSAVRQAKKADAGVRREGIRFEHDGAVSVVDLEVTPVKGLHAAQSDLLVVFRPARVPAQAAQAADAGSGWKSRAAREIARLERELAASRQQIRTLAEEYEVAKEEMRAVNEQTVSSELGNLLVGVDIPVVILDGNRRIWRFTPPAGQVFSLIATDVGRRFSDIASHLDVSNWDELIAEVTGMRRVVEREARDRRGHWYNLRVRPYTIGNHQADGVLMALLDIDAVKRSLEEAREARAFAEAAVETVREPLLVLDAEFRVLMATSGFYETFLVTPGETEGRSLFELGNGQWNIPRLRHLMEELLPRGNRIENFEVAHEFPSLGYRNVALNARQVPREFRGAKTILLAIEDITDRIRAEERLRIRELTLPDGAPQAILSVESDGRIVMANRMAEIMFGYTREELLELPLEALVPEHFRRAHESDRAGYFAAPKFRSMGHAMDLTGRRKDGTEFPVAVGLSHMHTKAGMLAVGFVTDLSGQYQAEEALRASEERFALFMNHLPAAAFMKDLEGRYVYVNPGFGKLASLPLTPSVGATDPDLWPEAAERLRDQDRLVIQTGHAISTEDSSIADGRPRYFQTVRFPIPSQHGQAALVAGIAVEITERKLAEQEKRELLARLATAQEEERRRIARELHDDLTQRLAGLAMDLGGLAAERHASRASLKRSLRGMQRRVVQVAEISRHIAHELHPSELDDLGLVAAIRAFSEDFVRRENIEVDFSSRNVPKELRLEMASCLYKVTQESLTNVSKHSGAKLVWVVLDGTTERIRLRIKDAGAGFRPESQAARVGLGILSMRERVELLHGSLSISSHPGQGTELIVELPLEEAT